MSNLTPGFLRNMRPDSHTFLLLLNQLIRYLKAIVGILSYWYFYFCANFMRDSKNLIQPRGITMKLRQLVFATLLVASSAAMATGPQGPGAVTLTNTTGNVWTAAIGDTPALGAFTDVFTFSPSATTGSIAWGGVHNTSYHGLANITFTSADLNGTPLITGILPAGAMVFNFATLFDSPVMGPLTLTIHGTNTGGGSYGGDLNVTMAPVPEPGTLGMMLGGAGLLALAGRRKKAQSERFH